MSIQPQIVAQIAATPAERFEACVSKLERVVGAAGQPLDSIKAHPAVRPVLREMLELLAASEAARDADRPDAEVVDIAAARQRLRGNMTAFGSIG